MIRRAWTTYVLALSIWVVPAIAAAQQQGSLTGTIVDPLGGRVAGATVTLVGEQPIAGETRSNQDGVFTFQNLAAGRYHVVVTASGFEAVTTAPVFVGASDRVTSDVRLQVGAIEQAIVVTASASEVSQAETGAPVTVIDEQTLEALNKTELSETLRLVADPAIFSELCEVICDAVYDMLYNDGFLDLPSDWRARLSAGE